VVLYGNVTELVGGKGWGTNARTDSPKVVEEA
jgi:hypothetical protein